MDNSFGKSCRLLKTEEFSSVFALRRQRSRHFIQVWRLDKNAGGIARLGLVVAKKTARRANRRNYMKRLIRDWFRRNKHQMPDTDFIVRVRVAFEPEQANEVQAQLAQLLLDRAARH